MISFSELVGCLVGNDLVEADIVLMLLLIELSLLGAENMK